MAEKVNILKPQQHNGYVKIELATDGYRGWIAADCLCCIPETAIGTAQPIRAASCVAVAAPDVKSAPLPACLWARLCGLAAQKRPLPKSACMAGQARYRQAIWQARH